MPFDPEVTPVPVVEGKTEEQVKNLLKLKKFWLNLSVGKVNLNRWTDTTSCGTIACIGGWCALSGLFPELVQEEGPPCLIESLDYCPIAFEADYKSFVAHKLFGDYELFKPRGSHKVDQSPDSSDVPISHHAMALRRILWNLGEGAFNDPAATEEIKEWLGL
jgi:hypothetical protein